MMCDGRMDDRRRRKFITAVCTGVCRIATPLDFPAVSSARAISRSAYNFLLSPLVGPLFLDKPRAWYIGSAEIYIE